MPKLFGALIVAVASLSAAVSVHAGEISWQTDLETAAKLAAEKNVPLLLYFTSSNCPHCVRMKRTFAEPTVAGRMTDGFVAVWMDYGSHPKAPAQFKVRGFPTTVMLRPDRAELRRVVGYQSPDQFLATLKQVESVHVAGANTATTVK